MYMESFVTGIAGTACVVTSCCILDCVLISSAADNEVSNAVPLLSFEPEHALKETAHATDNTVVNIYLYNI